MDQIFIKDLVARGIIGVNDWERESPQEIVINVVLYLDLHEVGMSDDIRDSVDYDTVAKEIQAHIENTQRFTVEALAADLAELCLMHERVKKVRVRVEKSGALPDSKSAGVEIERKKKDLKENE